MARKRRYTSVDDLIIRQLLNYASRIGGFGTLDRDIQIRLLWKAEEEANRQYMIKEKYSLLYRNIEWILANAGVPRELWGLVKIRARNLAECWARRNDCSTDGLTKLSNYGIPTSIIEQIIKNVKDISSTLKYLMP